MRPIKDGDFTVMKFIANTMSRFLEPIKGQDAIAMGSRHQFPIPTVVRSLLVNSFPKGSGDVFWRWQHSMTQMATCGGTKFAGAWAGNKTFLNNLKDLTALAACHFRTSSSFVLGIAFSTAKQMFFSPFAKLGPANKTFRVAVSDLGCHTTYIRYVVFDYKMVEIKPEKATA